MAQDSNQKGKAPSNSDDSQNIPASQQAPVQPEQPQVVTPDHPYKDLLIKQESLGGLSSDVHQALVTISNITKDQAYAHAEVANALDGEDVPEEVRSTLNQHLTALQPMADLYHAVRDIMFKYTR